MREISVFEKIRRYKAQEEGRLRTIRYVKEFLRTNPIIVETRTISAKNHLHSGNATYEVEIVRMPSGIVTEPKLIRYIVTDVSNDIGAKIVVQNAECGYAEFTDIYR